jgi:hypothetical protein
VALARTYFVLFGIPLALVGVALLWPAASQTFLMTSAVAELLLFTAQKALVLGSAATLENRRGIQRLERGDALGAAKVFARVLRLGDGKPGYVNNLALALIYSGELGRARELMAPVMERANLPPELRGILLSTWAMLTALLGELDVARAADAEASHAAFSVAEWIIAARERRWPFTRPEIKGAWTRHLYDVLEAFVAGRGYRDAAIDRPLPLGLARALSYDWPEMKAFLGS